MADDHTARQLELTVLSQIRDNMTLMAQDLRQQGAELKAVNNNVVSLLASRYDEQIAEARRLFEVEMERLRGDVAKLERETKNSFSDQEVRIRDHDRLLARLGLGMAISGSIGGTALGAVIVQVLTNALK